METSTNFQDFYDLQLDNKQKGDNITMIKSKWFIIYENTLSTSSIQFVDDISDIYDNYFNFYNGCNELIDLETNEKCDEKIFEKHIFPYVKCTKCDFDTSNLVYGHNKLKLVETTDDNKKLFFTFSLYFDNGNSIKYDIFDFNNDTQKNNRTMWFNNTSIDKSTKFCR